jgi:hypothetical protein
METVSLIGSVMGLGLASGVRLYATMLAVGLGIRFGIFDLHPGIDRLRILSTDWVLGAVAVAYLAEFFADKIPWLDSLWDAVHTLIRPLGAAMISATALGSVNPEARWALALLSGGVALAGHSTKAGTRLAANHSPEPFSNIFLSLLEDGLVFAGTWLALEHPLIMLGIVAVFLVLFLWLGPKMFRLLKLEWTALVSLVRGSGGQLPDDYREKLGDPRIAVRAAAGTGVRGLKNSTGWLSLDDQGLAFVARRWFRLKTHRLPLDRILEAKFRNRILLDQLRVKTSDGFQSFDVFKDRTGETLRLREALRRFSPAAPENTAEAPPPARPAFD